MDDSDKTLEDFLDSMGVPTVDNAKTVSDISYDPEKKMFIVPESDEPDNKDYSSLNKRKAIFKKGCLLKSKKVFNAFVSKDYNEEIADLYIRANTLLMQENTILMVLKEGIIRSKYSLSDTFAVSNFSSRGPEMCHRFIKTLSTKPRPYGGEEPAYVTILVNPDFDADELKTFFDFSDESVINSDLEDEELDLTSEVGTKLKDKQEKVISNLLSQHLIKKKAGI